MTLTVLDSVDMIDIVLDVKEHGYGISKEFGKAMIAVTCLNNTEKGRRIPRQQVQNGWVLNKKYSTVRVVISRSALLNMK